jgi:hypothetical protein
LFQILIPLTPHMARCSTRFTQQSHREFDDGGCVYRPGSPPFCLLVVDRGFTCLA